MGALITTGAHCSDRCAATADGRPRTRPAQRASDESLQRQSGLQSFVRTEARQVHHPRHARSFRAHGGLVRTQCITHRCVHHDDLHRVGRVIQIGRLHGRTALRSALRDTCMYTLACIERIRKITLVARANCFLSFCICLCVPLFQPTRCRSRCSRFAPTAMASAFIKDCSRAASE